MDYSNRGADNSEVNDTEPSCEEIDEACRNMAPMWFCFACGSDFPDPGQGMECKCSALNADVVIESWGTYTGRLDDLLVYPRNYLVSDSMFANGVTMHSTQKERVVWPL